jgi:hypothetical protein
MEQETSLFREYRFQQYRQVIKDRNRRGLAGTVGAREGKADLLNPLSRSSPRPAALSRFASP